MSYIMLSTYMDTEKHLVTEDKIIMVLDNQASYYYYYYYYY